MSPAPLIRPIVLLSAASFVSIAAMRVGDSLLPQVATEFDVTAGEASIISTAYTVAYSVCQLVYGALGDRFGKYRMVALMTLLSSLTATAAGIADSLGALGAARLAAGATAAAIVPLSLAFIGDHVAYEHRQTVLARFLTGTILGIIAGQIFGGVVGEWIGWRSVFPLLGSLFLIVGILLLLEQQAARIPPPQLTAAFSIGALINGYALLFRRSWARIVLATVFIEGFLFYGAFTYIGAYLHQHFRLDYATVGLFLGCMGLGGLLYAVTVHQLVRRLGERGLALGGGGIALLGLLMVAVSPLAVIAPAVTLLGLGLHMLHNTLQTNATQMAPESRGLAVSTFANALFLGQAGGIWLCGLVVDRLGYAPVFIGSALGLALVGLGFAALLRRRPAEAEAQAD